MIITTVTPQALFTPYLALCFSHLLSATVDYGTQGRARAALRPQCQASHAWPGARPTVSLTPLHFPFVLPLSHHIFSSRSAYSPASRTAGFASRFPEQEESALLRPGGQKLLRAWWEGHWGRSGVSGEAAPRPGPPRGRTGSSASCGFLPPPPLAEPPLFLTAPILPALSHLWSRWGFVAWTSHLPGRPWGREADLLLDVIHLSLEVGRQPWGDLYHRPAHWAGGEPRPIMTVGRLVQNWDLSPVWLTPNPVHCPGQARTMVPTNR